MALNSSGVISLGGTTVGQSVNLELGRASNAPININETDVRNLFGVPTGQIRLSDGYGKSLGASLAFQQSNSGISNYAPGVAPYPIVTACGYSKYEFSTDTFGGYVGAVLGGPTGATQIQSTLSSGLASYGTIRFSPIALCYSQSGKFCFATCTSFTCCPGRGYDIFGSGGRHAGSSSTNGTNSPTRGYYGGGNVSPNVSAIVDGIIFATDTLFNPSVTLAQARTNNVGLTSCLTSRGYYAGGHNTNPPGAKFTQIDSVSFTTQTVSDTAASLGIGRAQQAGYSNHAGYKGYMMFGEGGPPTIARTDIVAPTRVDMLNFSTEALSNPVASPGYGQAYSGFNATKGFIIGGYKYYAAAPSVPGYCSEKITFSFATESFTNLGLTFPGTPRAGGGLPTSRSAMNMCGAS